MPGGGSLSTGGSLTIGGSLDPTGLYHSVLKLNPHEWERVRESASQRAGFKPHPFWSELPQGPLESGINHYLSVMRASSPHIAARKLDLEHMDHGDIGGGFFSALRDAYKTYKQIKPILKEVTPHVEAVADSFLS